MTEPLLTVENVVVDFRTATGIENAVRGVSYDVARGETLAVVGESGSGKSVIAHAIMSMLAENARVGSETKIIFDEHDISDFSEAQMQRIRGDRISMIFQEPLTSLNPIYKVGEQVAEIIQVHRPMSKQEALAEVVQLFREVQLPDPEARVNQYPHEMSGGQRQRLAIARALAMNSDFILLDEPTSALELSIQAQIIDLLRDLRAKHDLSYMFISHDLKVVKALCHNVIVMQHGNVIEQGPISQVLEIPKTAYTQRLVDAAFNVIAA